MTSYANSTLPWNNIQLRDVKDTLGDANADLGQLVTSPRLNPYSVRKPVGYGASGDFYFDIDWVANASQLLSKFNNQGLHIPTYRPSSPYRLSGFRGYQHLATAPSMTVRVHNEGNVSVSIPIPTELNTLSVMGLGSYANMYPAVVMTDGSGSFRAIVTAPMTVEQYVMEYNDPKPTISLSVSYDILGYRAVVGVLPCFSSIKYSTAVTGFTGNSPMLAPMPWTTLDIGAPGLTTITTEDEMQAHTDLSVVCIYTSQALGSWSKGINFRLINDSLDLVKVRSITVRRTYTNKDFSAPLSLGETSTTITTDWEDLGIENGAPVSMTNIIHGADYLGVNGRTTALINWGVSDSYNYMQWYIVMYDNTSYSGKAGKKMSLGDIDINL